MIPPDPGSARDWFLALLLPAVVVGPILTLFHLYEWISVPRGARGRAESFANAWTTYKAVPQRERGISGILFALTWLYVLFMGVLVWNAVTGARLDASKASPSYSAFIATLLAPSQGGGTGLRYVSAFLVVTTIVAAGGAFLRQQWLFLTFIGPTYIAGVLAALATVFHAFFAVSLLGLYALHSAGKTDWATPAHLESGLESLTFALAFGTLAGCCMALPGLLDRALGPNARQDIGWPAR